MVALPGRRAADGARVQADEIRYTVTIEGERTIWRAGRPVLPRPSAGDAPRTEDETVRAPVREGVAGARGGDIVERAREAATRLVERAPRYAPGWALAGAVHQQRRDWSPRPRRHARAATSRPTTRPSSTTSATRCAKSGDAAAAVAVLQRGGAALAGRTAVALNNLGLWQLLDTGDVEGAIASSARRSACEARLRARPSQPRQRAAPMPARAWRARRCCARRCGQDPLYAEAWNSLGAALREDGHAEGGERPRCGARSTSARAMPKALLNLAQLQADLGAAGGRAGRLPAGTGAGPRLPEGAARRVRVLQREDRLAEALQAAEAAVARAPGVRPRAHLQRGEVLRAERPAGGRARRVRAGGRARRRPRLGARGAAGAAGGAVRLARARRGRPRLRAASAAALARGDVPPLTASAAHRFVPCSPDEQRALAREASRRLAARLAPLRAAPALAHRPRGRASGSASGISRATSATTRSAT